MNNDQETQKRNKAVIVYMIIVALVGLALGLSDAVWANYFRDAYNVDAWQRGLIEFPREAPGVLGVFILSGLAFLGDKRLSLISMVLSMIGLIVLGLVTPPFSIMLIFLFINSLGMHMFIPLYDSLGMSLAKGGNYGTIMGRFNSIRTGFGMLAALLVFFGFRNGFFSFMRTPMLNFLIAAGLFAIVFCLFLYLMRITEDTKAAKSHFVFRKRYTKYYILAFLFGIRKQIMFVFAPWVLIELLGFGADYMALLIFVGAGIGVFFLPMVGKWIDKYGTAKIMIIEAAIFIAVYILYAIVSAGLHHGWFLGVTAIVGVAVAINIADRTTMYFGMVRNIYMRSIAVKPEDVTPTLATGMAVDHVLSIASAILCGWIWVEFGPHFVFVFAAVLAAANMFVALSIRKEGRAV